MGMGFLVVGGSTSLLNTEYWVGRVKADWVAAVELVRMLFFGSA